MQISDFPKEALKRIGVIKNELLAFGVVVCLILNVFAIPLDAKNNSSQNLGGLIMHLSTIPILLLFTFIYWFAYLKLPSSQQELRFTEEAHKMLLEHTQARAHGAPKP